MATIKVKFRPSASDGQEGTLFFQVIHDRVVRQWHSDYKIYPWEWNINKRALATPFKSERREHLLSVRNRIRWDINRFKRIIANLEMKNDSYTADEIIEEFVILKSQQPFFHFMKSVIEKMKEMGKRRTSETYTTAFNSLRQFRKEKDVMLDEFDSELMQAYEAHLTQKGLIPNSISFHMRILRATYNRAVERGITEDKRPFRHVYTGIDKTMKRAVDIKTMRKIKDCDLSTSPAAEYARNMFLLSFYLRGMSFVDMAYLKKTDLRYGHITYRRRKTGQLLKIKWTAEMQRILSKYPPNESDYLLPIITNQNGSHLSQYRSKHYKINAALKIVAKEIGLKMPLTLYCSRHSWASIAKQKGIPIGVISDGLGHNSELTTQIYLSNLDTSAVDKANSLIINLI